MLGMCAWKQVCQADVFWEGGGLSRNNNRHPQLPVGNGPVKAEARRSAQLAQPADGQPLPPGVRCGKDTGSITPGRPRGS